MIKRISLLFGCMLMQPLLVSAQDGQFIDRKDSKIYYQTFGNGTPILIINGGPGMSSEGFIPLAKQLSKDHTAIIYDQRGTGKSTMGSIDYTTITLDQMIKDIEDLRTYLGIEQWIVLGHSFGGMLAYYYASKHPDRISAMIQSSSGGMDLALLSSLRITGGLTSLQRDSLAIYTEKINRGDDSYHTRLKRGEFLAPAYLYDQKYVPVIAHRLTQGNSEINSLVWHNMQQIRFDTKNTLKKFDKPVLILQGKQDVLGPDIAQTSHKLLPNSKLVILDRCGHYGWLDRPDIYFREIEAFLINLP